MSPSTFDALSALLPGEPGASRGAARRVLVDGISACAAAREIGVTVGAVGRVVRRMRELEQSGCPTCHRPITPDERSVTPDER